MKMHKLILDYLQLKHFGVHLHRLDMRDTYTLIHLIHFIETRLQNTIGIIIKKQMGWLTGWLVYI